MTGVGYAAFEIIVLILIGAVIGFLIGWILRRILYDVDLGEYEARIKAATAAHHAAETRLADVTGRHDAMAAEVAALRDQITTARAQAQAMAADLKTARSSSAERDGRIEQLESELTGLRVDSGASDRAAAEASARAERAEADLGVLRAELDAALATAADKEAAIGRLEAELAGAGLIREASEARAARISELEVLVVEREADRAAGERVGRLESELADVRDELRARSADIAKRDAVIADLQAGSATGPADGEVGATSYEESDAPSKDRAVEAMAGIAKRTAGDGPAVDDDLKEIHGVGPKLERLLKGMGITSFRQVARFSVQDVAIVTAALDAFPGRIERDDWMSSAAAEHESKYGEPA